MFMQIYVTCYHKPGDKSSDMLLSFLMKGKNKTKTKENKTKSVLCEQMTYIFRFGRFFFFFFFFFFFCLFCFVFNFAKIL